MVSLCTEEMTKMFHPLCLSQLAECVRYNVNYKNFNILVTTILVHKFEGNKKTITPLLLLAVLKACCVICSDNYPVTQLLPLS